MKAAPLRLAANYLRRFMSPVRPLGGWREEWAVAAVEVMSHDLGAVDDPALASVRSAQTCTSLRVRRAAASFQAVRDPASAVAAYLAMAMNTAAGTDVDRRIHALEVGIGVR